VEHTLRNYPGAITLKSLEASRATGVRRQQDPMSARFSSSKAMLVTAGAMRAAGLKLEPTNLKKYAQVDGKGD